MSVKGLLSETYQKKTYRPQTLEQLYITICPIMDQKFDSLASYVIIFIGGDKYTNKLVMFGLKWELLNINSSFY